MGDDGLAADGLRLLLQGDLELLGAVDDACARGARRANGQLACRVGCTACCTGLFDITALDGWRLRRGLAALHRRDPQAAAAVAARAAGQWRRVAADFPGDRGRRVLGGDESARRRFFARYEDLPCPALEPARGACLLYAQRPLSCRTYGLPVRAGGSLLPPCPLNFGGAAAGPAVVAATVEPDPDDREGTLLRALADLGVAGDTVVAAALAPPDGGGS